MNGIGIAARYYREEVAPALGDRPHAAALLGPGSEVLGYDDVSPDHDFGRRVQIFFPERDTVGNFFARHLGFDPGAGAATADWLLTPAQLFASLTRGAVFHDPDGELRRRRDRLAWYPDDVWRYALAAGWLRVGQEEAFVGRAGGTGDDLGSRLLAARLVRDLMRLAFLVERRWAPYGKWLGRATNELHLGAAVDPAPRRFHDRDIRVVGAERFTVALVAPVTDPVLRGLIDRLGLRHGHVPRLPGTIDQAVDSTDVLGTPERFRAAAPLLGLSRA